jgi:hypothetical protein
MGAVQDTTRYVVSLGPSKDPEGATYEVPS